jgi:hypothetical protein
VPERAALAKWLRHRRDTLGLAYAQMAADSKFSAATLKRAADGRTVPTLEVVTAYVMATRVFGEEDRELNRVLDKAELLWRAARHATGG